MVVDDVELRLGKRRRDLVFHDLDARVVAVNIAGGVLELVLAADVQAHAGVKFQRLAAGRGLGVAEHHADLFAELVGENARRLGLAQNRGELAQRLRHEPRLHAHRGHAHFAFQFRLRHQRGDGVNDDDVERVRARERFANRQRFLAGVRLRHQQIVQVHAEFLGVAGVQRVFRVNERREAAGLLRVGDDVEHQRRFAGRFRPEDFHDPSARDAADAQRQVNRQPAGRDDFDFHLRPRVAQAHDRAVAVGLGDGGDGGIEFAFAGRGGLGIGGGAGVFFSGFVGRFGGHKCKLVLVPVVGLTKVESSGAAEKVKRCSVAGLPGAAGFVGAGNFCFHRRQDISPGGTKAVQPEFNFSAPPRPAARPSRQASWRRPAA